jgi:hypothetical protein
MGEQETMTQTEFWQRWNAKEWIFDEITTPAICEIKVKELLALRLLKNQYLVEEQYLLPLDLPVYPYFLYGTVALADGYVHFSNHMEKKIKPCRVQLPSSVCLIHHATIDYPRKIADAVKKVMDAIEAKEDSTEFTWDDIYKDPEGASFDIGFFKKQVNLALKKYGYQVDLEGDDDGSVVNIVSCKESLK